MGKRIVAVVFGVALSMGVMPHADATRLMYSGKWQVCATPAGKHVPHCKRRAAQVASYWTFR